MKYQVIDYGVVEYVWDKKNDVEVLQFKSNGKCRSLPYIVTSRQAPYYFNQFLLELIAKSLKYTNAE